MRPSLIALAATLSTASAAYQGFNYGATKSDGSFMYQADFEAKFKNAKNLVGTSGFTSARLYTMIQGGSSTNEPISAIPAAIAQDTSLLLGLWASGGSGGIQAEITALKSAISQYGDDFTSLVVGISVGSEDLYRSSATGVAANAGIGADAATVASYISLVRAALVGTSLSAAPIGHVDTWTAWVDGSNSAVISAADWIGFDAYPYFQNTMANGIENGKTLFDEALAATQAAVGSKEVWITETGWPVSGSTENLGVPSTANAETYWKEVGCPLFGNTNVWWYTQQDADVTTPNPSFGLVGTTLSTTPLYDLSCDASSSSSSSAVASSTGSSSGATTVAPSVIASLSTAATSAGAVASSGDALGPSQVAPVIVSTAVASGGVAASSGSAAATGGSGSGSGSSGSGSGSGSGLGSGSGSGSGSNGTVSTASSPSSTPSTISDSSAAGISASFFGVAAVFAAALAAL